MKEEKEEIPLKTILQNFLNHVENLEVAREESNNGEGEDQYEKEFQVSRNKDFKLDELFYNSFTIILRPDYISYHFNSCVLISGFESIQRRTQEQR